MTFTDVACNSGQFSFPPNPYTDAGYSIFTSGEHGFATWCEDSPNYAGPGMFINTHLANANLTKDGGAAFSINAIELAHAFSGIYGAETYTFTGHLMGGGTVSQTFTIGPQTGDPTFVRFEFNDLWMNLASVDFASQTPGYYQFTNILLDLDATAIPEPASVALLGTGLIGVFGIGAVRRRRRSGSA